MPMSKKKQWLKLAEELFVKQQLTLAEIAAKLPVSESTLRKWSREEGWAAKRKNAVVDQDAFHGELFELAKVIGKTIRKDLEAGVEVKPARYYALGRILDQVNKTYAYEEKVRGAERNAPGGKVTLRQLLESLNDQLFPRGGDLNASI